MLRAVQQGEFPPPRQLDPSIDPALEAVCLKAMALKPEDRYASPRALADDIERWLADEPVTAWREPLARRARRWARRNRTAVTAAAAAVLVALVGTGGRAGGADPGQRRAEAANAALAIANAQVTRPTPTCGGQRARASSGSTWRWRRSSCSTARSARTCC